MTIVCRVGTAGSVYIGRKGKGEDGYFGNPHPIGYCVLCGKTHDRKSCVAAFKEDFEQRLINDAEYKKRILALKDKKLACFCFPLECHGDVIKEWLDNQ